MSERARIFLALAKIFPERQEDSYGPSKYLVNSFPSRKIFNTRDKPDKNKNDGGSLTVINFVWRHLELIIVIIC